MSKPKTIMLETGFAADGSGMSNVSLITTGIEAAGHGIYLDEKTAETAMQKMLGKSVKSYLRHDGAGGDRLGDEIGFFSGIYRQGAQIKATAFEFLESFKRTAGATAEKIQEMAQRIPGQFGVSLVLSYLPVWVMGDGSEIQAGFLDTPPEGALRRIPSMRVLDVLSADFVSRPAANPNGLLSAVDAPPTGETNKPAETTMSESKTVEVSETIKLENAEPVKVAAEVALEKPADGELKAALEAKTGQVAALQAEKDALTAALAAKDEAHKADLAKAVTDATAELSAKVAELETFDARKLGIAPLEVSRAIAHDAAKKGELPAPAPTDRERWEQYSALLAESPERAAKFKTAYLSR